MCKTLLLELKTAIYLNNIKQVKKLLKSVQTPLSKNPFIFGGYGLLKLAIGLRKKKIAILLINKGARLNNKYRDRSYSPLDHAVSQTYPDIVNLLVSKGANVIKDAKKFGILINLCVYSLPRSIVDLRSKILKCLLNNGANTDVFKHNNNHLILDAILYDSFKLTRLLLQYGAQATSSVDYEYLDCKKKFSTLVERIKSFDDSILLHAAIVNGNPKIVEILIDYGADIHCKTKYLQRTPLMLAIEEDQSEIVGILVDKGAKIDVFDENGMSPLHYIIRSPKMVNEPIRIEMLEELAYDKKMILMSLMYAGANVNETLEPLGTKLTFFTTAAMYGHREMIQALTGAAFMLNMSLVDYSIVETTKMNTEFLSEEQRNDQELMERLKNIFMDMEFSLVKGLLRAYYCQVPIDETMLKIIRSKPVNDRHVNSYIDHVKRVESDLSALVESMKKDKIRDSNVTVWKLLTSSPNRMVKYYRNKDVRIICTNEYFAKYDCYSYKLQVQRDAAIKRIELLDKTTEISFLLFKSLPFTCCEQILDYFDNDELKVFWYKVIKAVKGISKVP